MTYGQFFNCIDGYHNRIDEQMRITDYTNYILGAYIRSAVGAKRYVDKPFLAKENKRAGRMITDDHALDLMIDAQIRQ